MSEQILSIEHRAEMIRRAILLTLICPTATILSCLLLGVGLMWTVAEGVAVAVFVAGITCMLGGTIYYLREILVALSSVREEAKYYHFMARRRCDWPHEAVERRQDWQRPH